MKVYLDLLLPVIREQTLRERQPTTKEREQCLDESHWDSRWRCILVDHKRKRNNQCAHSILLSNEHTHTHTPHTQPFILLVPFSLVHLICSGVCTCISCFRCTRSWPTSISIWLRCILNCDRGSGKSDYHLLPSQPPGYPLAVCRWQSSVCVCVCTWVHLRLHVHDGVLTDRCRCVFVCRGLQ